MHEVERKQSDLTEEAYRSLGLAGGSDAKKMREKVGAILSVGYGNSKTFYKRLLTFGISLSELKDALEEAKNGK